jgi:hypothetical protein
MWFDRKPRREVTEEAQHWPTERMIAEAHADYATPADLEPMDDDTLLLIADICEVESYAPEECIPCAAYALYMDRQHERLAALAPTSPEDHAALEEEAMAAMRAAEEGGASFQEIQQAGVSTLKAKPVVERFADQVGVLQSLVTELLEGDPIPPPEVSLEELALLAVAAQKWVKITEAQGTEMLSPQQQAVLDSTKALVSRLRHDTSNH